MNFPILSRGSQATIDKTPIVDKKLRFASDTCRLFFDVNHSRIEITDFVKGLTYDEIISLESPLPKIYLTSDSFQFMIYEPLEERWRTIGPGGETATHAVYDQLDQQIDDTYIKEIFFNEDGNMIVKFGNDREIPVDYNRYMYREIERLEGRINELQTTLKSYTDVIDIIKEKFSSEIE